MEDSVSAVGGAVAVEEARSAVIHLERIHKIYKMGDFEVHALRGVSLDIHRGEWRRPVRTPVGLILSKIALGWVPRPGQQH